MDITAFRAQLDRLDALLRAEGMACGPDVWQAVFRLLASLERQGRLPADAQQLAPLLGPLFCRHPEEQARFPLLFAQWLAGEQGANLAAVNRAGSAEQAAISVARRKAKRVGWLWGLSSLGLVAVLVTLLYFWVREPLIPERLPTPPAPVSAKNATPAPQVDTKISIVDAVRPRLEPEPPSTSLALTLRGLELALNWLPWCFALGWLAKRYHQRWILNSQKTSADDLFNQFRFERLLTPIFGGAKAERALRNLRAAQYQPTRRLDVVATAQATARNGDYFQPVYRNRRSTPEHLLLVRSQHRNDLQAALVEELVARFRQLGLQVQAYRFRDDPHRLVRWGTQCGEYLELAQLVARHTAARLLIISETDILVHPYSGEVRTWLKDFEPWQDRVWLHHRDASPAHATLLAHSKFLLLPLSQDSLPALVTRLTTPTPERLDPKTTNSLLLPALIAAEPDAWLGEKPPYGTDLDELLRQLEHFLGSYGLRLLRAVAVYPKPQWSVTQALDFLLFNPLGAADPPERREQRLARLSRLPWLTHVHLPDWLREALLLDMDKAERQRIVSAWQKLFGNLTQQDGFDTLKLEIRTPSKRQIKLRLADLRTLKQADYVNDAIFANILLGGKLGLLDFRLPRALSRLLPGANQWVNVRPVLLALLLAGAAGWSANQVWLTYGKDAYTQWVHKITIQENAHWQVELSYQADTEALANRFLTVLQEAKFQVSKKPAATQATADNNTLRYAAGGKHVAERVAQALSWMTYAAELQVTTAADLPANTLQIQLSKSYQHRAGFKDTLRKAYQKLPPLPQANPKLLPIEPDMVVIKPGKFMMGSNETEPSRSAAEGPQHEVTIAYAFALGKTEVTFAEYAVFAQATGRRLPDDFGWGLDKRPVVNVSFNDAADYVRWLAQQTGKNYRLPTEAEWEYAARAGSVTAYWWSDSIGKNHAVCDGCGSQWDNKQTAPVGAFKPNAFGLYDTAGNVWEWTQDCWHNNYSNAPVDGSAWLEADSGECDRRVVRGGSWDYLPRGLRSAVRSRINSDDTYYYLGFRVARAL